MKDVVLIRLRNDINFVSPPVGIGYLLKAIADLPGVRPVFVDAHRDRLGEPQLLERLRSLDPLLVGFTVFSIDYVPFRQILPKVHGMFPSARTIAGGPHVTGLPDWTLHENPNLDFVVKGEGEETLRQLVAALVDGSLEMAIGDIPNLVHRAGDMIRTNRHEATNVIACGAPNWDLIEPQRYPPVQQGTFHRSTRVVPILTSRGCPYPCTFCAGHTITGKRIRLRAVPDVVDEIEYLQRRWGFEEFIVQDENFTFHKAHVLGFADEIERRGIRCWFSFPNGIRLDRIDEEIVARMRRFGTYMVTLGIESASPRTMAAVKKRWDLAHVQSQIGLLRRHGITVLGCFILGFPGETMDDIRQTIDFAMRSDLTTAYFGNFLPLPGSEVFDSLVASGEIAVASMDWQAYVSYFGRVPYHPRDVSAQDLLRAVRRATLRFYLRPHILFGLMKRMTHPVFLKSLVFRAVNLFSTR